MKHLHVKGPNLFFFLIIGFSLAINVNAQVETHAHSIKKDSRKIPALNNVHIEGALATRYNAATANLLTRQDRYTMETFRANALSLPATFWGDWPGDQLGRWLSVLHVAEGSGWNTATENRSEVLKTVLPLQQPGGYFGTIPPKNTDARMPSGNAFALRGLLDAYEDTHDEKLLAAAGRMVDFFRVNFDYYSRRGNDGAVDEYYAHCIDGLVKLYALTKNEPALDLAERIADRMGYNAHTHHSLSAYRGIIDLYVLTQNPKYLEHTKKYLQYIRSNRIVSGGVPEHLPASEQDEGCALADYIITNLMMFSVTGEDSYIDEAELTLVNHFFMNQFHTGGFGHKSYGSEIVGGKSWQGWGGQYGSENPGCCSLWGQWALGQVGQYVCTSHDNGFEINLYADAEIEFPDRNVTFKIQSDFPSCEKSVITVYSEGSQSFPLSLRVPSWTSASVVLVNGLRTGVRPIKGRIVIDRKWMPGDKVEIRLESPFRLVRWPDARSSRAAIFKGPLCYGLSASQNNIDNTIEVATDKTGSLVLGKNNMPVMLENDKPVPLILEPIGEEWISGDVKNPNRIRILFTVKN